MHNRVDGLLTKEGHIVQNIRQRYFVLYPKEIKYYMITDVAKIERGSIPLKGSTLCSSDRYPHCFALTYQGKTWYIIAQSEQEKKDWMEAISLVTEQL